MEIRALFNLLYENGIDLSHLDAIHDIARRLAANGEWLCVQFEEWYAVYVGADEGE